MGEFWFSDVERMFNDVELVFSDAELMFNVAEHNFAGELFFLTKCIGQCRSRINEDVSLQPKSLDNKKKYLIFAVVIKL